MDIRVKKTKRAIQKAFVALLREKPIEKITVKEIAERAEINKTTFYSHYETLDALTAEMERQTVQLVCDNMGGAQQLLDWQAATPADNPALPCRAQYMCGPARSPPTAPLLWTQSAHGCARARAGV